MPSFENLPITIDFEVYCAECNKGLCGFTDVYMNKRYPTIKVGLCPDCLEALRKEYESEINDLKSQIEKLQEKIYGN